MKRIVFSVLATLALTETAHAQSPAGKFYMQLDGGASYFGETDLDGADATYDLGWTAGGRFGIQASNAARLELDVAYSVNDFDEVADVELDSIGLEAEISTLNLTLGVYVDLFSAGAITPYLGAGGGLAFKELETNFNADDEDTDVTAHGEVGLSFEVSDNVALVPHYRLLWLKGVGDDEQFAHWFRLGLRFSQ